jgi:hypothetical protein
MSLEYETFNWNKVKEKMALYPWAQATVDALREGFDGFTEAWQQEPPLGRSERFHRYFCKACATHLLADLRKPHIHLCPSCGEIYTGEPFDGTWRAIVHGSIVANMERAAILSNIFPKDERYREYIRKVSLFYVDNYHRYEAPEAKSGQGKILPHVLNEAIFVISIERALRMVEGLNLFNNEERTRLKVGFFRPAAEFIKPQICQIHNHDAWKSGAVAAAANFLGDQELLDFAIEGEFGWLNLVEKGVTEDGIWYEISPTYHYYTMSALLATAWIAKANGRNLFANLKFEKMLLPFVELAYENGDIPAYNDGWYGAKLRQYSGVYEQLSDIYPEAAGILSGLYQENESSSCGHMTESANVFPTPATAFSRNSVEALLYGLPELPVYSKEKKFNRVFTSTGLGVLENESIRIGLKATNFCGWHDHFDKLSIDLFSGGDQISADLGTSGYGIDRTELWNKSPVAHNMVVLNGERQKPCSAKLSYVGEGIVSAICDQAYDATALKRTLTLEKTGFLDTFEVVCEKEAVIDWVFHCKGEFKGIRTGSGEVKMQSAPSFDQDNGYDQIINLKEICLDGDWSICWKTEGGGLTLYVEGEKGTRVFTGLCYKTVGLLQDLPIVIIRRTAEQTIFKCRFLCTEN